MHYICTINFRDIPQTLSNGVLAHLARARHWQCRGERFESAMLHPTLIFTNKSLETINFKGFFIR